MRVLTFFGVCLAGFVGACADNALAPLTNGPSACSAYEDAAACAAHPECIAGTACPTCERPSGAFAGCYLRGQQPLSTCAAPSCSTRCEDITDATACAAQAGCTPVFVEDPAALVPTMVLTACHAGSLTCIAERPSASCPPVGRPPTQCLSGYVPAYDGGCLLGCMKDDGECGGAESGCVGLSEQECSMTPGCHAVYDDLGTCDCSTPGCCIGYTRCNPGIALCMIDLVACDRAQPECGPKYVVSYRNACYEGCVLPTECAE